jgi:hypothetical protein
VQLEADAAQGLLAVSLSKQERDALAASTTNNPAAGAGTQHQFVSSWNMPMWRELCRAVPKEQTLMPPRPNKAATGEQQQRQQQHEERKPVGRKRLQRTALH